MRAPKIFKPSIKLEFLVLLGIGIIAFTRPKEDYLSLFTLLIAAALTLNFVINWRTKVENRHWVSALGKTLDIEIPRTTDQVRLLYLVAMVGCLTLSFIGQLMIFYDPPEPNPGYVLLVGGTLGFILVLMRLRYRAHLVGNTDVLTPATPQPWWKIRRAWLYISMLITLYLGNRAIQADQNSTVVEYLIVWFFAIAALCIAFYQPAPTSDSVENAVEHKVQRRIPRWEVLVIVVLLVAAMLVRFVNLNAEPGPFDGDEANFAEPGAANMVELRINPFLNGFDAYSNLQAGLISVSLKLFGHSHFAARLPSALMGALTIIALYLLGCELYGWQTGLLTAMFAIGWTFHIQFSRLALNQSGDVFFGTLAMYFLIRGMRRRSGFDYTLSGIMLAMSQMFYLASIHLVVVMVGFIGFLFLFQRRLILRQWKLLWIVPVACLITLFPRLYYLWYNNMPFSSHTYPNILLGGQLNEKIQQGADVKEYLLNQVSGSYLSLFSRNDGSGWYDKGSNIMSPVGGTPLLIGVIVTLIMMWKRPYLAFPLLWGAAAIFFTGTLSTSPPMYQRIFSGAASYALLAGIGLSAIAWGIREVIVLPQRRKFVVVAVGSTALVLGLAFYLGVHVHNNKYLKWHTTVNSNRAGESMVAAYLAGKQVILVGAYDTGVESTVTVKYYMAQRPFTNVPDDYTIDRAVAENGVDLTRPLVLVVSPPRLEEARQFVQKLPNPGSVTVKTVPAGDLEGVSHYVFDSPGLDVAKELAVVSTPETIPTPAPTVSAVQACISIAGESSASGYVRFDLKESGNWTVHLQPLSVYIRQKLDEVGLQNIEVRDRSVIAGAIGPGINRLNSDYLQSDVYKQMLAERCQATIMMPWLSDLTSVLPADQSAAQYADRIRELLFGLQNSNPDMTVVLVKFYPANASAFVQDMDSGVTQENIAIYNRYLDAICNSKNPDWHKVVCVDPTALFGGSSIPYLLTSVTYAQLQADLAPDQTLSVADSYFAAHPDTSTLGGDGIHLTQDGKIALANQLAQNIKQIIAP